jgi:hypothetical protein
MYWASTALEGGAFKGGLLLELLPLLLELLLLGWTTLKSSSSMFSTPSNESPSLLLSLPPPPTSVSGNLRGGTALVPGEKSSDGGPRGVRAAESGGDTGEPLPPPPRWGSRRRRAVGGLPLASSLDRCAGGLKATTSGSSPAALR